MRAITILLGLTIALSGGCGGGDPKGKHAVPSHSGRIILKPGDPLEDEKVLYIGEAPKDYMPGDRLCATYTNLEGGSTQVGEYCLQSVARAWSISKEDDYPPTDSSRPLDTAKRCPIDSWDQAKHYGAHGPREDERIRLGTLYFNGACFWFESKAGNWWMGDDALRAAAISWLREEAKQNKRMNRLGELYRKAYSDLLAEESVK